MKYLIAGLGNIGAEYQHTRHNIGFDIVDKLAFEQGVSFRMDRLAFVCEYRVKNKILCLIKPTTFMNLSGKALHYWAKQMNVPTENILVLVDELAIPFGKIRIKPNGSDGGHNGLKSIQEELQTQNYPRLRFGIGGQFPKGRQVDYVLGKWTTEEEKQIPALIEKSAEAVVCFCLQGITPAMNTFNS